MIAGAAVQVVVIELENRILHIIRDRDERNLAESLPGERLSFRTKFGMLGQEGLEYRRGFGVIELLKDARFAGNGGVGLGWFVLSRLAMGSTGMILSDLMRRRSY